MLASSAIFNKNTSIKNCDYKMSNERVPSNCDKSESSLISISKPNLNHVNLFF
jgi:hypothetical protein